LKSVKETITSKQASKAQRTRLTYDYFESMQSKIAPAVRAIKNDYINKNNITFSKGNISRLV